MNILYMEKAIEIAKKSGIDIPVGAVIVKDDKIIAEACNQKEVLNDITAHAEILAIRLASKVINNWRLAGCDLYVTLEPCPMCASAIIQSRISNVFFGSYDNIYGAFSAFPDYVKVHNSNLLCKGGIMEYECNSLLSSYFKKVRQD